MTLTEAVAKEKEIGGQVIGMVNNGDGTVSECPKRQTTCDFYGVKVVTGAAGGHLFYTMFW